MTDAVAIIPARGGSKRIPLQNIRDFKGKPAIGWPIEVAQASVLFSQVAVSTDDQEIADCANRFGANTPFQRDASLANDYTGTTDVIRDAVDWDRTAGVEIPFQRTVDIDNESDWESPGFLMTHLQGKP